MEATKYNRWDFCPVSLSREETGKPCKVIEDFFSSDSLAGNLEMLKDWRDVMLRDEYYREGKGSPAGLHFFYRLNLKLIDAMYLIMQALPQAEGNKGDEAAKYTIATLSKLPEALSLDLYAALTAIFSDYSLPQYRQQLDEWLEHGLSAKAAGEFISSADLISIYENLQKLYNAAWQLCQIMEEKSGTAPEQLTADPERTEAISLYRLNRKMSSDGTNKLKLAAGRIISQVPSAEAIFYLGAPPDGSTNYLLILVADDQPEQAQSLACRAEDLCRDILPVVALVHDVRKLHSSIGYNNSFFRQALTCPLLYLSGNLILPPLKSATSAGQAGLRWERWHRQSLEFLAGAAFYIGQDACGTALFSLHQCTEGLLTAVIRGVLNHDIKSRNLSRLIMLTQMFTSDLADVFKLHSDEGRQQFDILKSAYIDARFKDVYEPDSSMVISLYKLVSDLTNVAERVYNKHLLLNAL